MHLKKGTPVNVLDYPRVGIINRGVVVTELHDDRIEVRFDSMPINLPPSKLPSHWLNPDYGTIRENKLNILGI